MSQPSRSGRWVWLLLAVVLAAAAWLAQGPDDDLLAPRTPGSSSATQPTHAGRAPGALALASASAASLSPLGVEPAQAPDAWWRVQHAAWLQRGMGAPLAPPAGEPWGAWHPPAQALVAAAVSEPQPQAPAFPHAWVGRVVDDRPRAVIAGAQRTWVLGLGDVLDGQWRLDTLGERQLGFTYLPLQQTVWVSARTAASP